MIKRIFILFLPLLLSSCATFTIGERVIGDRNGELGVAIYSPVSIKNGRRSYGGQTTVVNLKTKRKHKIVHSGFNKFHMFQMLWLSPGAYAIIKYEGTSQIASEIRTSSLTYDLADAPWFVVKENETTYYGDIIFNFGDSRLYTKNSKKEFEAELLKTKRKLKFVVSKFVTTNKAKEEIAHKLGLKNVIDEAVIIDD